MHPLMQEQYACPSCHRREHMTIEASCSVKVLIETDGDDQGHVCDQQVQHDTLGYDDGSWTRCLACGHKGELKDFIANPKAVFNTRRERVEYLIRLHDSVPLERGEESELIHLLIAEAEVLYPVLDSADLAVLLADIRSPDLLVALEDYKEGKPHE